MEKVVDLGAIRARKGLHVVRRPNTRVGQPQRSDNVTHEGRACSGERMGVERLDLLGAVGAIEQTCKDQGWGSGQSSLDDLRRYGRNRGWAEVANRRGQDVVSLLRPVDRADAQPSSLSATYGLTEQPLHTDGAHLSRPPNLIALHCANTSPTSTLIWRLGQLPSDLVDAVQSGVFLVRDGRRSFCAVALLPNGGIRYDPGCMTPLDERSSRLAEFLRNKSPTVVRHQWHTPNTVLLIDNRRCLHGRASVIDKTRSVQRIAFETKESL